MNGSNKIFTNHLNRQAVIYVRQSDPKQVRQHKESAINQRALKELLLELKWKESQISIIDGDQGTSATTTAGRDSFQQLAADVSLDKVGIIMGLEVSRLARNNADWYRLLEICALTNTLIGDADGIYDLRDFNDRLLLGLKGTMSEAEVHTMRLRLENGRLSKARRGELVQHLPTGFVRDRDQGVILNPDVTVQDRIHLVFAKFKEVGSIYKVLRHFVCNGLKLPRRQVSGVDAGEVKWKAPTLASLTSVLTNPAYAGAFAYGRRQLDPRKRVPGRRASGKRPQPRDKWIALVKDIYPSYISWQEYEEIQRKIRNNYERMNKNSRPNHRLDRGAALLTGLVKCARCGRSMFVSYQKNHFHYTCARERLKYGTGNCQYLSAQRIDAAVVNEFFHVLEPSQIDVLEAVTAKQDKQREEQIRHLEQEVTRLEHAAKRADRQHNSVDPENRLVAATLEKRWEEALEEVSQAQARLEALRNAPRTTSKIPKELRESFADVGRRLPELWPRISEEARKALLRTLIDRVNLLRDADGVVQIRIAWKGGSVTEVRVRIPIQSRRHSETEKQIVARVRQLTEEGKSNDEIAATLNAEGRSPCRRESFNGQIVAKLKKQHGIVSALEQLRRGNKPAAYTIPELARLLRVTPTWFYRKIADGAIRIHKDPTYKCYLFPRTKESIDQLKRLMKGKVPYVWFQPQHQQC